VTSMDVYNGKEEHKKKRTKKEEENLEVEQFS
jgi:hypothetical protein